MRTRQRIAVAGRAVGAPGTTRFTPGLSFWARIITALMRPVWLAQDAQVLTYLRMSGLRVGLLFNFHARLLKEGLRRFVI